MPSPSAPRLSLLCTLCVTAFAVCSSFVSAQSNLGVAHDPAGDTLDNAGAAYDLRTVKGSVFQDKLVIEFSVENNDPQLPSSGAPGELVMRFDIDADQDPGTGFVATGDFLGVANSGIGADFAVDFLNFDSQTQTVPVTNEAGANTGVAAVFTGVSLTDDAPVPTRLVIVEIPLAALGNDDGRVDFTVASGDLTSFGDVAPNAGFVTSNLEHEILLQNGRFLVTLEWNDSSGGSGFGLPYIQSNDSVMLYFFDRNNWEMLVKVLDTCSFSPFFWVFAAAATDVQYRMEVIDLLTGVSRVYENPLDNAAPAINDTAAFPTCGGQV